MAVHSKIAFSVCEEGTTEKVSFAGACCITSCILLIHCVTSCLLLDNSAEGMDKQRGQTKARVRAFLQCQVSNRDVKILAIFVDMKDIIA